MRKWFSGSKSKESSSSADDMTSQKTTQLPVVPYRVLYAEIPFYSDSECRDQVPDARIAILKALDPDNSYVEPDIVPTLKKYKTGQLLNWSLNNKRVWEECWYRNPETNKIEQAWTLHVEFDGKQISERTIKENRVKLDELEAHCDELPSASNKEPSNTLSQ